MLEFAEPRGAGLRAFLKVGGISLARQQVALASALGCKRIVCLTHGMTEPLLSLQHDVEAHGQLFHTIDNIRGLVGLVNSGDELIVISDGLLVDRQQVLGLIHAESGVLVQPVDTGLAAGFERIDLNWATAGMIRIPGRLVDQLMDLPADIDVISALTRIALQAGVPQRRLPAGIAPGSICSLIRNDSEAHAAEVAWFERHQPDFQPWSPTSWIARLAARRIGPTLLDAKGRTLGLLIGALALLLLALGASWFGYSKLGLGLCASSWIAWQTRKMVDAVEREMLGFGGGRPRSQEVFEIALDGAIVLAAGWGGAAAMAERPENAYFAPVMVVIMARLLSRAIPAIWARAIADRLVLSLSLVIALSIGQGQLLVQGMAAVLGLAGIAFGERASRITRP
jgi:hypothetical protein